MRQKNRWLVLIAAILTNLSLGAGYAWSVFQGPLVEKYGWMSSQAALAFSISFAMVPVAMIIFGPKVDKNGPRKYVLLGGILFGAGMFLTGFAKTIPMLYLTYGLLVGLGIGTGYGATTSSTVKWFPDKKGLAGGLTAAGFGSGAIILAPIANNMIKSIGVSKTFNYLGIILLVIVVLSSFFMAKPPSPETTSNSNSNDVTYKEMLKTGNFWILWVIYTMGAVAGMMIISNAKPIAETYSLAANPAIIVSIVGLANTMGRIVWGSISDKMGRYKTIVLMFIASSIGLLLLGKYDVVGNTMAILGIVLVALSFGGFLGIFPGITAENWGIKNASSNYGWLFTAYGVAAILGPVIAAKIVEASGDYARAFTIAITMALVGIVFTLFYVKKEKNKV